MRKYVYCLGGTMLFVLLLIVSARLSAEDQKVMVQQTSTGIRHVVNGFVYKDKPANLIIESTGKTLQSIQVLSMGRTVVWLFTWSTFLEYMTVTSGAKPSIRKYFQEAGVQDQYDDDQWGRLVLDGPKREIDFEPVKGSEFKDVLSAARKIVVDKSTIQAKTSSSR